MAPVTSRRRNVLLITGETYSKLIHPDDRTVRTLVRRWSHGYADRRGRRRPPGIGEFVIGTDGNGAPA